MEFTNDNQREEVGKLATRLLARDPVEFNAAINSSFTPDIIYRGHGLEIRGATNLKHAAWFWNTIDAGRAAKFNLKDIEWDEQKQSAKINTTRFIRPRLFPFFGVSMSIPVEMQFKSVGGKAYVSRYEEFWVLEHVLAYATLIKAVHEALFKNIWTLFILTLSNFTFATFAKVNSIDAVDRAKKALPTELANGIDSGFTQGSHLAQGWGKTAVNIVHSVAYPAIRLTESTLQFLALALNRALPFTVPYPYVYDAHAFPPNTTVKIVAPQNSKDSTKASADAEKNGISSPPSQDEALESNDQPALVKVAPSVNGTDEGKTVSIQSRIGTESKDEPAKAKKGKNGSMYDQLRKEGQDPIAEAAELEKKLDANGAVKQNGAQAHSSGEDEGVKEGHHANGNGTKKKRNKKKKNGSPTNGTDGAHVQA